MLCLLVALVCRASAAAGAELPHGWNSGYVTEPVFSSRMYWVEAGSRDNPPLVLIHGLGDKGWRDWLQLMPELAQNYRVIAFDLPGFGRSEKPEGKYSPEHYAQAIHSVLQQSDIPRFHLMGHSMGGAVALRLATRFPQAVDRLVLISAAGILERSAFAQHSSALPLEAGMIEYLNALPEPLQGSVSDFVRGVGGSVLRWDFLPDPLALLSQSDQVWAATLRSQPNLNAAFALVGENFSGDLTRLPTPSLILWGEKDPVAPLRTAKLLAGQLPEAQLLVFPDMGHMPVWFPDKVLPPIKSFLASEVVANAADEVAPRDMLSKGDVQCVNQNGLYLTGRYDRILLSECGDVRLHNVWARELIAKDSVATLDNVTVSGTSGTVAVDTLRSKLWATNARFEGDTALRVSDSHLDLAGVDIVGRTDGLQALLASELVFSVSRLVTPEGEKWLHGVYTLGN